MLFFDRRAIRSTSPAERFASPRRLLFGLVYLLPMILLLGCGSGEKKSEASGDSSDQSTEEKADSSETPASKVVLQVQYSGTDQQWKTAEITLELHHEYTPKTARHFLELVEEGFYDGTLVHRIHKNSLIFFGKYHPISAETIDIKPTDRTVASEAAQSQKNLKATVGMAREASRVDSASSEFYINVSDNTFLDPARTESPSPEEAGYTVFATVAPESMPVVEEIASLPTASNASLENYPQVNIEILSARAVD
jgi:cyclophilin family peptidyl-prolyl cis-trans isomerase